MRLQNNTGGKEQVLSVQYELTCVRILFLKLDDVWRFLSDAISYFKVCKKYSKNPPPCEMYLFNVLENPQFKVTGKNYGDVIGPKYTA